MEKADPKAPALPRLKQSIADGQAALAKRTADAATKTEEDAKRQADLQKQRLADQQKAQEAAAKQLAAQQASDQQAAAQRAADERAAAQRAAAQRAATPPPAAQAPSTPAPQPAAATASTELRAISTPSPKYPPEAFRAGTQGEVQVEFTVATDGSVSNARVVRATPPRVFDREALSAVKRWRFQPIAAPVTTRRTIGFNPGG